MDNMFFFNRDLSNNDTDFFENLLNQYELPYQNLNRYNWIQNPFAFPTNNIQISNIENLIQQTLLQEKNPYKKVVSEKGLSTIEKVIYNGDENQKECPIMMIEFNKGDEISKLPCGHLFSNDAIERWLKNENHKCPVCRHEMDFKEIKKYDVSDNDISGNDVSGNDIEDLFGINDNYTSLGELQRSVYLRHLRNNVRSMFIDRSVISNLGNAIRNGQNLLRELEELDNENNTINLDNELQQVIWNSINDDD